jgi:hypothetical protein
MSGIEQLLIHQGAMFFGFIMIAVVAFLFFNAVTRKE